MRKTLREASIQPRFIRLFPALRTSLSFLVTLWTKIKLLSHLKRSYKMIHNKIGMTKQSHREEYSVLPQKKSNERNGNNWKSNKKRSLKANSKLARPKHRHTQRDAHADMIHEIYILLYVMCMRYGYGSTCDVHVHCTFLYKIRNMYVSKWTNDRLQPFASILFRHQNTCLSRREE